MMRTQYCPHCGSQKIHKVEEADGAHYHECEECQEAWEHHDGTIPLVGSHVPRG